MQARQPMAHVMTCAPRGRELRAVFAGLRHAVMEKFKDHATARYTSVSAFIFLRLFCPAIMNPKLFNMMPGVCQLCFPAHVMQRLWVPDKYNYRHSRRILTTARRPSNTWCRVSSAVQQTTPPSCRRGT